MPHEVSPDAPRPVEAPPGPVHPSAIGRILMGSILALGVYLGVRKLLTGAILAMHSYAGGWWLSFQGLSAVYAVQAGAVFFGAAIAAAGRAYGYSLGFIVGGVCGGLFLGFELLAGAPPESLVLYLQPPLLALLGLAAGAAGSRVWIPAPELNLPIPTGSKLSSLQLGDDLLEEQPRPTNLLRVLAGAAVIVLGVAIADPARHFLQKNSGGLLRVESMGQGEFITWQLATLIVLGGGVVAAAGTGAGIRHGLLAGMLGAAGVFGVCMKLGQTLAPIEYWLEKLQLDGLPLTAPPVLTAVGGGILMVALLGGWLGGSLFLPLAPPSMRKRLNVGLD
jgi:hypothetical protein